MVIRWMKDKSSRFFKDELHGGRGTIPIQRLIEFFIDRKYLFQLMKTNVFQLNILIPFIEILDAYMAFKDEFSPDEFCILLFLKEKPLEKFKYRFNPVKERFSNIEEIEVKLFTFPLS